MDTALDLSDASKALLDLSHIRFQLIRLEDTITFHLIERVQHPLNGSIYVPGAVKIPNSALSLMDWMLYQEEHIHSAVRRYQSPDEYPFFPEALQQPILAPIDYPPVLHANDVNVNSKLKHNYINNILPAACAHVGREERGEAKENFGSAAVCDVLCLQALSRRIHFGKFVAEAKFVKETERFVKLIKDGDREGIGAAITDKNVELQVLERLRLKAKTYGTDPADTTQRPVKVPAESVVSMYKDFVIPLTKEVEVEYLMQRLKGTQWE